MKFIAALAAFAGAAAAMTGTGAVYTTVTETAYTTYCPGPTSFEFNSKTYTVTEACTLTITDCPDHACTYVQPVYTSSAVACGGEGCYGGYQNTTAPMPTATGTWHPSGCTGYSCGGEDTEEETPVEAGAGKVAILSGAALAGVLAVAAAL